MRTLHEVDRRILLTGVLRLTKAAGTLASAALAGQWSFRVLEASTSGWLDAKLWDGNPAAVAIRLALHRALLASVEQARGLYDLARSPFGYTVVLATLARGSVEALARVHWIAASDSADELLVRHASVEFSELRYPAQHNLSVHNVDGVARTPVVDYRAAIDATLRDYGLVRRRLSLAELTTSLLGEIYDEPRELYSGLSASAHGFGWATANFYDTNNHDLRPDDQMIIEYCEYVIDCMVHVNDRVIRSAVADEASIERWASVRDQVFSDLDAIIKRRRAHGN